MAVRNNGEGFEVKGQPIHTLREEAGATGQ